MLLTLLNVILTAFLTCIILALYIKRTLPGILEEVAIGAGESISEQLNETLSSPNMKRAMSILGQKSGESRASDALRNKAANAIVEQSPVVKFALDKIGISPLEGLQLMNDPLIGQSIQGLIGSFLKGEGAGQSPQFNERRIGRM